MRGGFPCEASLIIPYAGDIFGGDSKWRTLARYSHNYLRQNIDMPVKAVVLALAWYRQQCQR